ncbi:Uma2 family endonuclease [soil metagenome]
MASLERGAEQRWTYPRYLAITGEEWFDVIEGERLDTPSPGTLHQQILGTLMLGFARFVERHPRHGVLLHRPVDVVLSETDIVQPDLLYIRTERVSEIVGEFAIHGAPDLIVEIIAPYSIVRDRHQKLALYQRVGVLEYWIVDPANHAIEVLVLEEGEYQLASFAAESGAVVSRVLEGFQVEVAEVMPR